MSFSCRVAPILALAGVITACGGSRAPSPADSAAAAAHAADSMLAAQKASAPALLDSVRVTMAKILKNPASAKFDSLIVTQPPMKNGAWPSLTVCGRIGGKPGVNGASGMAPFIYVNPLTVLVLDKYNADGFAARRTALCNGPDVKVIAS